jgi:trans-AT polyketide synthase, acyltransferase and oxidoreductase domains
MLVCAFPGQGSQQKGMGSGLFERFPELTESADRILGYSIQELCLMNPEGRLNLTQYAQPALFVVSALAWLSRDSARKPAFLGGHSLGEYAALFAGGCFDFETGIRLVQKRGELMGQATGGSMIAVLGVAAVEIERLLINSGLENVSVANYNGPTQLVLSGLSQDISSAAAEIERHSGARCIPLRVSAPFHSRYMDQAASEFAKFLEGIHFADPRTPIISNVTAEPYKKGAVRQVLSQQMRSPVRWWETMRYLRAQGVTDLEELGPRHVLQGLWQSMVQDTVGREESDTASDIRIKVPGHTNSNGAVRENIANQIPVKPPVRANSGPGIPMEKLGSEEFRRDYGSRYAYMAGAMYCGIASTQMVLRAARAGFMGFFGAGGLKFDKLEEAIRLFQSELGPDGKYGMNLLSSVDDPKLEEATVALYLRHQVRFVEAAGYMQISPSLVQFRFSGCHRGPGGRPVVPRRVVAKVSRPEVAAAFMQPPSEAILKRLVAEGKLHALEADLARRIPISEDICVESDSGGHTDGGVALALFPSICKLRDEMMARYNYPKVIRVGAAGGIGTPVAVAAAFVLGADFVLTGSINQCSPEAGTSAAVKDILAGLDVQDTAYAPSGDLFELGARVQVVRKGTLFPGRANKLEQIYNQYESLDQIEKRTRAILEETYFKRSFEEVWRETKEYLARDKAGQIEEGERNPKRKMALVFKWYFAHTARAAIQGTPEEKVNYQIHCGPAMGAFNRYVKGTELEDWRTRHVDVIAERLMEGAADILTKTLHKASSYDSARAMAAQANLAS